jgi:RNA polymerase sigma-70 factor (ECF subfamily)
MEYHSGSRSVSTEKAQEGTVQAYREYAAELLGRMHSLTRDSALAQDAVQETFLRFFIALAQGEEVLNVRAWLHRVAHNYVCDIARSAQVRTAVSLGQSEVERIQGQTASSFTDWAEAAQKLLAPREWQCVQLRAEGFDYTEIAVALAIRPGTVGALLHRATRKLGSMLLKKGKPA